MADKTVTKYAGIVTSQIDPNATKRNDWVNVANAVGHVDGTHAKADFTKKQVATHYVEKTTYDKNGKAIKTKVADKWKETFNHPWTLAFHTYGFNIPSNAHIKRVSFVARMKCDKNVDVLAPVCDFRITNPDAKKLDDDTKGLKTGWHKSHYLVVPQSKKITNSWDEVYYHMELADVVKAKITPNNIKTTLMGCDLIWRDATEIIGKYDEKNTKSSTVYISWVKCIIEYDVPEYHIDITNPVDISETVRDAKRIGSVNSEFVINVNGTETSPYQVEPDEWFELDVHCTNPSLARGSGNRYITIDVPWASEIRKISGDGRFGYDSTLKKHLWTVPVKSDADYVLRLKVKSQSSSKSRIVAELYQNDSFTTSLESTDYWYVANQFALDLDGKDIGYCDVTLIPTDDGIRAYELSCVDIRVHGVVSNNNATIDVTPNFPVDLPLNRDGFFTLESVNSEGSVNILSQDGGSVNLQVPFETEFIAILRYCFYPLTLNDTMTLVVHNSITDTGVNYVFPVQESHTFVNENNGGDVVKVQNHRVYTEVESDVVMIPIVADDIDSSMIMTPCQINMNVWEDLDYIGCVPLEHLHFDPKSTFKDTLLNSTYKNKRYMGKKLATDEDITLNVRLHPRQVTTIQGLIEMDKPIPINANHRCFESDALNHRGWAEIYSIKTEETNPHWYKCDIDVKYLTHNLKTRFNITRGKNVDDKPIPSVLSEVFASGDNLSDTSDDKFFNVETDGTFMYNEDYEDVQIDDDKRNFFSIDNGEYIHIQTEKPLSHDSQVRYTWNATLLPEDRENNVSKIIKLVDKQGNSVFEYEYNTLEFITSTDPYTNLEVIEEIQGTIIYRLGEETHEENFTYRYDDGSEVDEDEVENVVGGGLATYGSSLNFNIQNNILEIIDEGFNGNEVHFNNLKLNDTEYWYVVEWRNNNSDGDTESVDCTVDFQVQDTVLATTYANKFGKLLISPFPVADKNLLFTREAEEGTIYYYEYEEGKEFSYIVEPYYQYHNGTDLIGDGISIFDLNYGFDIVYIQNGLVRLGFNRVDNKGHMYLGKYDPQSNSYITTNVLRLDKYVDLNLNSISDDKIEVQASDSTFTIYRGHPYIKINHNDEDIYVDTLFNRVWAEQVGADKSIDLPSYWDLLNTENLLPESIGGVNTLNPSDVNVTEVVVDDNNNIEMSWYNPPSTILNDEDTTFTIQSSKLQNYSDEIYIDGNTCSFGSYSFIKESDNTPVLIELVSTKTIMQSSETARLNATVKDWSNTGVSGQTVYFYEVYEPYSLDVRSDKSIMQTGESATVTATLHDEDGSLIEGEFVAIVYEDNVDTTGWSIDCTLNKSIIQTGETITFTITIKDANNNPVEDVFVGIYEIED